MTLFAFSKIPQKHYKNGENSDKLGPVSNTRLGPVLTLETPNLGPVFNSTAYIYIYLFIYLEGFAIHIYIFFLLWP